MTRLPRYYEPLRHPAAPGLSLTGRRLVIPHPATGLPVLRALPLGTCCRHSPGAATGCLLRSLFLSKADLRRANLQGADLTFARLQGVILLEVKAVTASQIKLAKNWRLAFYSDDFLAELDLPADHNETVKKKLAEIEKEKEKAAAKP